MTFAPIPGMKVIGIGHRARQGKDTAAAAILRVYPFAVRVGFADDLYAIARVRHGMLTKDGPLLQRLGVEYRDEFGADVWIRAVYAKLLETLPKLAVIPDVRFPNELDFIKTLGGTTVRVIRMQDNDTRYVDPSRNPEHISETALDGATWDRTLFNREGRVSLFGMSAYDLAFDVMTQP